MPHRLCPVCESRGQRLEAASEEGYVSYYRCSKCRTVWVYDPTRVHEPIRIVTKREAPHQEQ